MIDAKRITFLLPFTLETQREHDDEATPEGDLLCALDDAYGHGSIPSDASWYKPIAADLPVGWLLHNFRSNDAGRRGFAESMDGLATVHVIERRDGLHVRVDGTVPMQVMAAVLAVFSGKVG